MHRPTPEAQSEQRRQRGGWWALQACVRAKLFLKPLRDAGQRYGGGLGLVAPRVAAAV
jgi:hypothetical protein